MCPMPSLFVGGAVKDLHPRPVPARRGGGTAFWKNEQKSIDDAVRSPERHPIFLDLTGTTPTRQRPRGDDVAP